MRPIRLTGWLPFWTREDLVILARSALLLDDQARSLERLPKLLERSKEEGFPKWKVNFSEHRDFLLVTGD